MSSHVDTKLRLELEAIATALVTTPKGGREQIIAEVARVLAATYDRGFNAAAPAARASALREEILITEAREQESRSRRVLLERELAEMIK